MAQTPPLCIIHNPQAASGRAGARWRLFRRLLWNQAEFRPSTEPGQAAALAQAAAREGFPTVVAAGGDGTVHEVANGLLLAQSTTALGVLPLGSGNDYARMIGTPFQPRAVADRLLSSATWEVDVGEVTDVRGRRRFFLNTLGLGLSGAVTWEAARLKRAGWGLRGLPLYGLAAVRAIWSAFHSIPISLTMDGQSQDTHLLYMAVALGRCEGGGFVVAPDARLDDGWFDYLHATRLSRLQALGYVPRLALGKLPEPNNQIRRGHCRVLEVRSAQPFYAHVDGEQFLTPADGSQSIQVRLLPRALQVRGSCPA